MSLEIKVPPVGESITEVTLSSWLKKDGDTVEIDEAIAELESDKATFELTAERAGVLKTIAKEGDVLPIGAVVCTIEGAGATVAADSSSNTPATAVAGRITKEDALLAEKVAENPQRESAKPEVASPAAPKAAPVVASGARSD